ncbi:hypothetical protein BJP23_02345 [Aeromonas veronii bv. veronii]|nr:hypothetical protein B565_1071 [Aeromonas veronii B565]EKB13389.1 hypothetical protein HMPREF1169_02615 [Aeromonas veronii AER397]OKP39699.1 hypothetical protein BJP23_02345 [Aeromonas veronii bv. veronii]
MTTVRKVEVLLDSVYTVEPLNEVYAWNDGHWNYQWSGRSSKFNLIDGVKQRIEPDGSIIIKNKKGNIIRLV